jgi:hypothetical protein
MRNLFFFLLLIPLLASAQIRDHKRIFSDTLEYKNFNQGFLDSQEYFIATGDYFVGLSGFSYACYIPSIVCSFIKPKDRRFMNANNPNVEYILKDIDYYNGYKYGATKKKRKRILQGALTPIGVIVGVVGTLLLFENN